MKNNWLNNKNFFKKNSQYIKGDVVDVGCGTSKYRGFITGFAGVKSYTGIDFYQTKGVDIIADMNKPLPIKAENFDSAICISVIEHLKEPQLALDEIFRILRPGGHVILTTPWVYSYHHEPDDYFRYSRYALQYMFKKSGFEIISIVPTGGKYRVFLANAGRWFPRMNVLFSFLQKFIKEPVIESKEDEKNILRPRATRLLPENQNRNKSTEKIL